ncbi:putative membrane-bound dehydrogenase domain-containing protein [Arenibacter palladensis]|uniref:Putative membrane-bound dehydrogenase domain-containing protein n=1 Tax=Arenibacter palladensis TaxID=237373 RepID=A0A1M5GG13_9FLAO|nr:PVC-type heme-binding CxxCH protein [Arenibacter palladensis]SHG02451.1 putative membrane-bound dehydrogenase domain-containing protein [Arenibacter palladensis]
MFPNQITAKTLVIIMALGSLASCKEQPKANIDFLSLSEQEKRNPEYALAAMEVEEGLNLELFASEPMVTNPTNMAIDAKGRIWVCEAKNYRLFANPDNTYDDSGDRILILEDTNGDGKADTSKVFYQGEDINAALGIAVLGNKVIVSVSPKVFIFTDENGDDLPDSKEILFQGIEGVDHDHGVHAFVFGPDGRLYFNFGNNGKQLLDKNGEVVLDMHGQEIVGNGQHYREGMAFRMNMDGTNLEVLGHNFRNPYEIAIDSYGGLWQSDNDDDGNRGTRINYVMEYGNYGYRDLLSGASWRERRTGWHNDIPKRHWHLNDPGTVPNLLQTGSGSPCGILVYEDKMLPQKFQNQPIHAEPGHNVVRAYIIGESEAGYTAKIENLVKSKDDWFRPDDVTTAPDGSLFISDWYDGGVGGHKAEDIARGRIYRLSTGSDYKVADIDPKTEEGAVKGLLSGNMDLFYQSWQKLHSMGEAAQPFLTELREKGGIAKARALWLGLHIPTKSNDYIELALLDEDPKFRMQGIRMARFKGKESLEKYLSLLENDKSPQVRREAAIALRFIGTEAAAELWANLAVQHNTGDRWYLEALGIGADKFPELYFKAWRNKVGENWKSEAGKEIVWRIRAKESVPMLVSLIKDQTVLPTKLASYFRALDFKDHPNKDNYLMEMLGWNHPLKSQIQAYAIGQMDAKFVYSSPKHIKMVKEVLPKIEGTPEWIMAIKNLELKNQNEALFRVLANGSNTDIGKEAANLLLNNNGATLIDTFLHSQEPESSKIAVLERLNGISNPTAVALLKENIGSQDLGHALTRKMIETLGNTGAGQEELYQMLKEDRLAEDYKTTAVLKLMTSWNNEIRTNAPKFLSSQEDGALDISKLVELRGNASHGKEVYSTYCSSCHMAAGNGIEFGPELSDIGNKLSKQFLYSNIIYPSAGINFGFEGYSFRMNDGKTYTGYILSRTEDEITIKMMGGTQKTLELQDISEQESLEQSLMTEGLAHIMPEEDLVDLVAYLETLKVAREEQ